jgi:hypothetical protein
MSSINYFMYRMAGFLASTGWEFRNAELPLGGLHSLAVEPFAVAEFAF